MPGADMERAFSTPAEVADAAAVTEVVGALASSLYGETAFSQADLEGEWSGASSARSRGMSTPTRSGAESEG